MSLLSTSDFDENDGDIAAVQFSSKVLHWDEMMISVVYLPHYYHQNALGFSRLNDLASGQLIPIPYPEGNFPMQDQNAAESS